MDLGAVHVLIKCSRTIRPRDPEIVGVIVRSEVDPIGAAVVDQNGIAGAPEPVAGGTTECRNGVRDECTAVADDGVPVAVTIVTGERTVLGILAGPLFAGLEEALGER